MGTFISEAHGNLLAAVSTDEIRGERVGFALSQVIYVRENMEWYCVLEKIISGGLTSADRASLDVGL
jgi:hypothetical protein